MKTILMKPMVSAPHMQKSFFQTWCFNEKAPLFVAASIPRGYLKRSRNQCKSPS